MTSPFRLLGSHHLGVVLTFPVYKSKLSVSATVEERTESTAGSVLWACLPDWNTKLIINGWFNFFQCLYMTVHEQIEFRLDINNRLEDWSKLVLGMIGTRIWHSIIAGALVTHLLTLKFIFFLHMLCAYEITWMVAVIWQDFILEM